MIAPISRVQDSERMPAIRASGARGAAADRAARDRAAVPGRGVRKGYSRFQSAGGNAAGLQQREQRRTGAPYIGFDLGKRGMKLDGDLLVGKLLEVIQHECQPLMLRQLAQCVVDE